MAIRPIRLLGDAVLRTPCDPVTSFDAELRALVTDLLDTVTGKPGRAGVAANQIGVSARVFSYAVEELVGYVVNPVLTEVSEDTQDGEEGCLSIPVLSFDWRRARLVVARGFDMHGEPVTIEGSDLLARAIQHETDHLDGVLFVERLDAETRRRAMRAIRGLLIAKRVSTARSRAHERFASSSPCDDEKCVQSSPQSRARRFIIPTKRRSVPARCTASAIAASLPDTIINPFSSVSSRTRFPRGSRPMPDPE